MKRRTLGRSENIGRGSAWRGLFNITFRRNDNYGLVHHLRLVCCVYHIRHVQHVNPYPCIWHNLLTVKNQLGMPLYVREAIYTIKMYLT